MDIVLSVADLQRRQSTRTASKVLEAAIEQAFGYPIQIQKLQIWMSPMLFEEGRVPERMTRLIGGVPQLLAPELQAILDAPTPIEDMPSAAEYVRRARARKRATR